MNELIMYHSDMEGYSLSIFVNEEMVNIPITKIKANQLEKIGVILIEIPF